MGWPGITSKAVDPHTATRTYGTWHGKCNFSADDRTDNPHIAARTAARTISGFRVEQLADSVRNYVNVRQDNPKHRYPNDPCDVFVDPLAGCCAQSLPSGFHHFQPESTRKICVCLRGIRVRPCWSSAAPVRKIRIVPHNYPRVSARNNHRIPWKS